ncbi:hypothetical protein ACN2C6_16910 [Caulobacter sp. ErkDOM-YI]|uniref:sulfotransferase family protein n=1 Tax=unclassified Caulobacter TaxID=2648921 RepID=UPI003AF5254C
MAKPAKTATTTTARRALVVAGMHRSGTSAMARLLSLSGATLPERVMAPAADNPAGFWEPWEMVALNDKILASVESSWDDVFTLRVADRATGVKSTFLGEAKDFVAANYGAADLLVMKDPRASVLAPFWREVLIDSGVTPLYVIMVRNPLAVARSLFERNRFSTQKSVLVWTSYMLAVERDTRGSDRLFVDYDAMLDDWRATLAAVEATLGRALPRSAEAAAADIEGFLNRSHRHHEATAEDLSTRSDVWSGARAVFEWFEAAARGEAPPVKILDVVAAEIAALDSAMGAVCMDMRREVVALQTVSVAAAGLREELASASQMLGKLHGEADAARQGAEAARLTARDQIEAAEKLAEANVQQAQAARQRAEVAEQQAELAARRAFTAEQDATAARQQSEAATAETAVWRQRAAAEQSKAAIFQRSRDQVERELVAFQHHANGLEALAAAQANHIAELQQAIAALQASTSWRLTAPLRRLILLVKRR